MDEKAFCRDFELGSFCPRSKKLKVQISSSVTYASIHTIRERGYYTFNASERVIQILYDILRILGDFLVSTNLFIMRNEVTQLLMSLPVYFDIEYCLHTWSSILLQVLQNNHHIRIKLEFRT